MQPRLRAVLGNSSNPHRASADPDSCRGGTCVGLMTEAKVLEKALLDDVASIHSLNV